MAGARVRQKERSQRLPVRRRGAAHSPLPLGAPRVGRTGGTASGRGTCGPLLRRADGRGALPGCLCEWRSLRLRVGEADCGICELSAWMESFGLRLEVSRPAPGNEVFLHLLRAQQKGPGRSILAGACKLCGTHVALGTCEFDHMVPVSTVFRGHGLKTGLENSQPSRFSPTTCEAHVN